MSLTLLLRLLALVKYNWNFFNLHFKGLAQASIDKNLDFMDNLELKSCLHESINDVFDSFLYLCIELGSLLIIFGYLLQHLLDLDLQLVSLQIEPRHLVL